jgi:biopolymer transport protein ExbD
MLSLTAFIFYYWFLAFTVRIGPIPWMEFGNLNFFRNVSYASGIQIPKTKYHKPVVGSKRHLIHISITKSEKIRVNGYPVRIDNFLKAYSQNLNMDPQAQPLLIIDRNCKMDIINQVIVEIKKKPCRKIIFCTNDKPYRFK